MTFEFSDKKNDIFFSQMLIIYLILRMRQKLNMNSDFCPEMLSLTRWWLVVGIAKLFKKMKLRKQLKTQLLGVNK